MEDNIISYKHRAATLQDIPELIKLGMDAYGIYHKFMSEEDFDKMKVNFHNYNMWEEIIRQSQSHLIIENNTIIAMVFLMPNGIPNDIFDLTWAHIRLLGVAPQAQGKGLARLLTHWCIDRAKENNEQTIALHTSEQMHAARHIYEDLGFKILKEIPKRLGMRYWIYTLSLN